MLTDDPRHGTNAGYVAHRARNETACAACRDAHAVYARARRDRPEDGGDLGPTMNLIPSPLTVKLADMAIEHARAADNGADAALAWLPHIHPTQVPAFVGIVLGKAANTKRATVDDRLRHLAAEQRRAALVPAHGARRRLQALAFMGYPVAWIAARIGLGTAAVWRLQHGRSEQCEVATHLAVKALYREHAMCRHNSLRAKVTRRNAREKGWLSPLEWDDLDAADERTARGWARTGPKLEEETA